MAPTGLMLAESRYAVRALKELPKQQPVAELRRAPAVVLEAALAFLDEAAALGTFAAPALALVLRVRFARPAEQQAE